jgi:hypothetical protein
MPATRRQRKKYVNGCPPDGVAETRTFGAVVSFRAMACDFCRFGPHERCGYYGGMRDRVLAEGLFQCPEYKRVAD